jgi:hypothetical protein
MIKRRRLSGQIVNFVWSHFEKDLENTAEIVERNGSQLHIFPNPDSVQIAKGRNLGIPRSPANLITPLEQKFGQVRAVLPGNTSDQGFLHREYSARAGDAWSQALNRDSKHCDVWTPGKEARRSSEERFLWHATKPSGMQVSHHARVIRGRKWSINSQTVSELPISSMPWPRISIVTPSYNQGKYIERTVRSVLLQRYPNLEYILMDGGSTDDTLDRIAPYMKEFSYSVSQPDGGQAEAIANGFARSSGAPGRS